MQRYDATKASDWGDAVERQVCPFCNEGPFTVVAAHVNRVHGVDKKALRDMLGLPHGMSICDPTHSASMKEHNRVKGKPPPGYTGPKRYNHAARQAMHKITPETITRILQWRAEGWGWSAIGERLQRERVPNGIGGTRWLPHAVQQAVQRRQT